MNSSFSVDDLTDSFWQPPAPAPAPAPGDAMTRSQSEWALQKLLEEISVSSSSATDNAIVRSTSQIRSEPSVSRPEEEEAASEISDVVEIHKPQNDHRNREPSSSSAEIDPSHYQAILKSKLELACAAVALRVSNVKPENSSGSSCNQKQPSPIESQTQGSVVAQMSPGVSSLSAASSLGTQSKQVLQVRQATSGSSRDDSDDDDLDGDAENAGLADVKRARRMLSNRESARRSRRRKQEQMNELDTQVSQLRTEHSTLLKCLSEMNRKCDTAAVDNRILKADIETLRTKVKMAEETVKRVTGKNPLLLARPNSIPFDGALSDSSQPNSNHTTKPANPNITGMNPNQRLENNFANNSVVPSNMSPISSVGLKNSTKVPKNVAFPNHLPEQVNPFVRNGYETLPHWDRGARKNKPQE